MYCDGYQIWGRITYPDSFSWRRCKTAEKIDVTAGEEKKHFLDAISPLDEYGFEIRPQFYWLPESTDDEIKRMEMNLAKYEQYLLNGSRFPEKINQVRLDDFNRLKILMERVA